MFKYLSLGLLLMASTLSYADKAPTTIDQAMYFKSRVADAGQCKDALYVKKHKLYFKGISNPALTCPDAYAWKQFLEAVDAKFWQNWSIDQQIWVEKPKAYCATNSSRDCCELNTKTGQVKYRGSSSNNEGFCPKYPEANGGTKLTIFNDKTQLSPHVRKYSEELDIDKSRIARDVEAEIVYHNKPFFNFSVLNDLYHTNGLAKVFKAKQFEAEHQAPYRPTGKGVNYPEDAVMFKVDLIAESAMKQLGYISDHDNDPHTPMNNAEHPYITMEIYSPKTKETIRHYLVAVTGASKALPNWHWYAFEHVNNVGRCDYLGCNDSFGFSHKVSVNQPDGTQRMMDTHYIPPHQQSTEIIDNAFIRNKKYASAKMNKQLKKLFKKMDIGQGHHRTSKKDKPMPSNKDSAWQHYRLKGTQTSYYHNDGTPVVLGASVTEGGFVNTSSCMSCHVQASVNINGLADTGPVGGTLNLSLDGIPKVTNGAPQRSVFYQPGSTKVNAARIDFVWGILNANPLFEND